LIYESILNQGSLRCFLDIGDIWLIKTGGAEYEPQFAGNIGGKQFSAQTSFNNLILMI